ncbi:hypothetical protein CRE_04321 [Caenorhabditis remanei]|uniref:Uncharacterized protein n=1 Tax=Caenorhabditis remanei TaxID=31234 RepID=E3NE78_CAERE|nr:hypothetical protein CRE_04321 [Caenorhabditis remanei]
MPMMTRRKTKEITEKNIGRKGKLWETFTVDVIPELLTAPCEDKDRDVAVFDRTDFNQSEENLMELMRVCPDLGIERAVNYLAEFPLAEAIRRGRQYVVKADTMIIIDNRIKNKKLREEEERFVGIPKLESCPPPPPPPKVTKMKEEPKRTQKKATAPRKATGRQKSARRQKAGIPKVATGVTKKAAEKKRGVRLGDLARELMASAAHWARQRKVSFKCPKRFLQDENAPPRHPALEPMDHH